ncbi:MAG: hypothetical protein ABIH59_03405 [archaeon]
MTKDRFNFDFHVHVPARRIEEIVSIAIDRDLNSLCLTGYSPRGDIKNFDYVAENKDSQGNRILNPNKWDIQRISPVVLKLTNDQGSTYLFKGGELNSRGYKHILCLGITENRTESQSSEDMLRDTNKQGGIAIFPHLYKSGCGEQVYLEMIKRFPAYLTGLEINGQFPESGIKLFGSVNPKASSLANKTNAALFGFSDIHGHYKEEHLKIGDLIYSSVPANLIELESLAESFREIMLNHRDKIQIHGRHATLLELVEWKGTSIIMDLTGQKKSEDF